jgi:hypothetical protein
MQISEKCKKNNRILKQMLRMKEQNFSPYFIIKKIDNKQTIMFEGLTRLESVL